MRICDPHIHLFMENERRRRYLLEELGADVRNGHDVLSVVYVEAASAYHKDGPEELRPVGETEWIVGLERTGLVAGIVGYADLRLGNAVEEVLMAHIDAAGARFRGVRARANWDDDPAVPNSRFLDAPGLLDDPRFHEGARIISRLGLSLDVFVYFHQLDEVARLAAKTPDLPIVLNHFGTPLGVGGYAGRADEVDAELRRGLAELASFDNVFIKLGGIGWPGVGHGWEQRSEPPGPDEVAAYWGPLERWCIERFGAERAMCESNYPADRPSLPYRTIWDAHMLMTADLSASERSAVLYDTAVRVYRIAE